MDNIYQILILLEFAIAVPIFIILFFIKAPYGRYTKRGWGPVINARFSWFIMEMPSVILPLYFFITAGAASNPLFLLFIIIWEAHYIQRTFVYPALMNRASHKMPLLILLFSGIFNTVNGIINSYGIFVLENSGTESLLSIKLIAGLLIFCAGFILNLTSDKILRNLRAPGESGYKIPEKGMYKYICSPNYLGEILEWVGWAILTWSPAGAAFLVFTIANLAPRAWSNLKWYRATFPDYPPERKALIPGIY
ncbi:MAG: DUF1295 domain-containing protein [Spirochaetales bacterium]|uniref:DUF1295 domain-containing protein n=1 Tax=Candidatus Thalassospirochaeta sargassi TaxID=3119039 RepID=A0AAJ1IGB7_9SPIO|nr:DUF1295 domain-containing protein [Spirochaetales bacterium]